jgi:acyl carrier protein
LAELQEKAAADGYSLVYVRSAEPIEGLAQCFQGHLLQFEGDREAALAVLDRFPPKYRTRALAEGDWPAVAALYRQASPTRFSRDPAIGPARAHRHKLKCLRAYWQNFPGFFLVALGPREEIVSVQGCMPREDHFDLYESVVSADSRTGFALAAMLRANLDLCRQRFPLLTRTVTRIYSDNPVSIQYYRKLGMVHTGSDWFYHLWLEQRRARAMNTECLRETLARFLHDQFLVDFDDRVNGGTDLFAAGFIDSFGFMELISFLETEFGVEYAAEELLLGQLNSLDGLVASVGRKLAEVAPGAAGERPPQS